MLLDVEIMNIQVGYLCVSDMVFLQIDLYRKNMKKQTCLEDELTDQFLL